MEQKKFDELAADAELAEECLTYVMKCRRSYELMGRAVRLLERLAKREYTTPQELMTFPRMMGRRRWYTVAQQALDAANADYVRCFPDKAPPAWVAKGEYRYRPWNLFLNVMHLAIERTDRWDA